MLMTVSKERCLIHLNRRFRFTFWDWTLILAHKTRTRIAVSKEGPSRRCKFYKKKRKPDPETHITSLTV